jgi:two-component system, chemotaxis family, CheB/CheR fusion protein
MMTTIVVDLKSSRPRCVVSTWRSRRRYSIAIVLLEYLGDRATSTRVQIFGTDLSDVAIEKARTGFYTDSIADEVTPERLQRFFAKIDEHYQISKTIRDLCVFVRQDVTRDPPFSRLDLVSCRNLLIYLDQTLQRQIIPLFHYSLNRNGFLVLGPSETIGRSSELFRLVNRGHQIYRRQPVPTRVVSEFPTVEVAARPGVTETIAAAHPALIESDRAQKETERLLLTRYALASILIDETISTSCTSTARRPLFGACARRREPESSEDLPRRLTGGAFSGDPRSPKERTAGAQRRRAGRVVRRGA